MIIALFYLVYFAGLVYFVFRFGRHPCLSVAYVGAAYYFYPGLVGYCMMPLSGSNRDRLLQGLWVEMPMGSGAYLAMTTVLACIILAAWMPIRGVGRLMPSKLDWLSQERCLQIAAGVSGLGFVLMIYLSGSDIFVREKSDIMGQMNNRGYVLWATMSMIGIVIAASARSKKYLIFFSVMILLDVYIGFRLGAVVTILAIGVLLIKRQQLRLWHVAIAGLFFFGLILYKNVSSVVKLQRWDLVRERLVDMDFYVDAIQHNEPMLTQAILNQSIIDGIDYEPIPLWHFMAQTIPFTQEAFGLNYDGRFFNGDVVFPGVEYGIASNPWAEIIASYDWAVFVAVVIFYAGSLRFMEAFFFSRSNQIICGFLALHIALIGFYLHRNTTIYQYNLHRQFAYAMLLVLAIAYAWHVVNSGAEGRQLRAGRPKGHQQKFN